MPDTIETFDPQRLKQRLTAGESLTTAEYAAYLQHRREGRTLAAEKAKPKPRSTGKKKVKKNAST